MVTKEETSIIIAPKDNLPQRLSHNSTICASNSDREGNNSIVPEKPSEDGYNWRKYGQKNVKGNEYIRSYYKCSHPKCQVKKQVERSHDGRITDITYLGKHDHVKPNSDPQTPVSTLLSVKVQIADNPPAIAAEDTPSDVIASAIDNVEKMEVDEFAIVKKTDSTTPPPATSSSLVRDDHGDNLTLKKRKKGVDVIDSTPERSNHESRVVVHTVSEVDVVNDGYRWRKYGQKMVKGNPNPRSYYRCSTTGCPVKKHVERASHDSRVVITTYEGEHDHSMPPIRTIVPQIPGSSLGGTESNGLTKSKSEESDPEKSDSIDPTATSKEVKNSMVMIKTDDHTSRSIDQETRLAEKTDPTITQTTQEKKASPVKANLRPEPSAEPDKKPVVVPPEGKLSAELNKKPKIVLAEAKPVQEPDKKPNSVPTDAKPSAEPYKKPEIVSTEPEPSAEPDKKPEIVPTDAKPSAEPDKKPEIVPTEVKPSEEADKKPEIVHTEAKPSEEPDKKPEIVPTEAKPSEEPNEKPKIVSTEAKSNGQPKC